MPDRNISATIQNVSNLRANVPKEPKKQVRQILSRPNNFWALHAALKFMVTHCFCTNVFL